MTEIAVHDHPQQTFIVSTRDLDIRILLRYSYFLQDWFISLSLVQDEENPIVSSRKLIPNRFILGHRALIAGVNWDVFCSGKFSTGPFDENAWVLNNYNLYYCTVQERIYMDFLERVTGYNRLQGITEEMPGEFT